MGQGAPFDVPNFEQISPWIPELEAVLNVMFGETNKNKPLLVSPRVETQQRPAGGS
ncbi:hypothetical protein LMG27174_06657 [Paraburkholderia rhynchosiae]|uniref:Uncharacterized protein n=1 Tax=Paraburkholderia rhynchosiae TaxID=487049 RepID=A0A6J5CM27_9BURK|nr:hypothetical protein LMG27174_06657 [Paraburkholderia rhynchosiae]